MRTTGGGQSALLLFDAIGVLNRETINYAVVGAMAASVHGVVRASIDADAVLSIGVQALKALEHRFKEIGFATKVFAGAPGNIMDAQNAIAVADNALDVDLLRQITNKFGQDAVSALEKLLNGLAPR